MTEQPDPEPTPRHLSLEKAFTNTEWIAVKALLIAAIAIEDPDEKVSILDAALDRAWIHGRHAGEVTERERCARIEEQHEMPGGPCAAAIRSLAPEVKEG